MSFSAQVKQELCRLPLESEGCIRAELAGMLASAAAVAPTGDGRAVFTLTTENPAVAGRIHRLSKALYGEGFSVDIDKDKRFGSRRAFHVECLDPDQAVRALKDSRIFRQKNSTLSVLADSVPAFFLSRQRFIKSYVRGVFLAVGFMADPQKTYNLELIGRSREFLASIGEILEDYDIRGSLRERNGAPLYHIKESGGITSFLGVIGASKALLDMENVRIVKEMRNGVNRMVNCELANVKKTTAASVEQVRFIRKIQNSGCWEGLAPNLRELAQLRLDNPDASIKELGEMMESPIGKSAVYHRLAKLKKMSETVEKH